MVWFKCLLNVKHRTFHGAVVVNLLIWLCPPAAADSEGIMMEQERAQSGQQTLKTRMHKIALQLFNGVEIASHKSLTINPLWFCVCSTLSGIVKMIKFSGAVWLCQKLHLLIRDKKRRGTRTFPFSSASNQRNLFCLFDRYDCQKHYISPRRCRLHSSLQDTEQHRDGSLTLGFLSVAEFYDGAVCC